MGPSKEPGSAGRLGARIESSVVNPVWRVLFWAAAAFNFIIGLPGMLSPASDLDARMVGLLILSFGIIYLLVARDPVRFGPVLWAGVVAKVGVIALLVPEAIAQRSSSFVFGVLAVDALFAGAFLVFIATRNDEI